MYLQCNVSIICCSMKQAKNKRSPKRPKSHLSPREEDLSTTPPSLGYHSDGCEESEDECVEAVEDAGALEDEGVTGLPGNKLVSRRAFTYSTVHGTVHDNYT